MGAFSHNHSEAVIIIWEGATLGHIDACIVSIIKKNFDHHKVPYLPYTNCLYAYVYTLKITYGADECLSNSIELILRKSGKFERFSWVKTSGRKIFLLFLRLCGSSHALFLLNWSKHGKSSPHIFKRSFLRISSGSIEFRIPKIALFKLSEREELMRYT